MERQKEISRGVVESTVALIRLWYRGIGDSRLLSANQALEIATLAAVAKFEIPQLEMLATADLSLYGDFGDAREKISKILSERKAASNTSATIGLGRDSGHNLAELE